MITELSSLTLSQCTLAGPVYTGMPLEWNFTGNCLKLECHLLLQPTLEPTLEWYSNKIVENSLHWKETWET